MSQWVPILSPTGSSASRAWEAVGAISQSVLTRSYPPLIEMHSQHQVYDESLLYGYLALAHNDRSWVVRTTESLNAAIDGATALQQNLALFGGLCGVGWVVEHLCKRLGEVFDFEGTNEAVDREGSATDDGDLLQDVDAVIIRNLSRGQWLGPYDLISGLVGFGTYFLERWPSAAAEEGIRLVLRHLEACSTRTASGVTWHSGPELLPDWQRQLCPNGYYNLGVAHGIPGVLQFLSELAAMGIQEDRVREILNPAVDWLIAQQLPPGKFCRFGSWSAAGESSDSRLTWCYGDLGILAVLLQVAHHSDRASCKDFTHSLLESCLAWPPEAVGINDAPLCHGAAGLAHIFNRIYQTEGDIRCRDRALFWLDRTLEMRRPGEGVGGYWAFTRPVPENAPVWEPLPAFLDGAIGVALTLIAALTPVEPQWDRLLLVSGRLDRRALTAAPPNE